MKVISRVLIVLGIGMILYAVFMDTTVSSGYGRVHNIGLQANQQLFVIIGCFVVLAGIILFAVRTLKKTPEQEAAELMARQAALKSAETVVANAAERGLDYLESTRRRMDLSKIKDACDQYQGCAPSYYTIPIPEYKANNARKSLSIPHDDQIFALIDFTFFGGAKEATVVAESGLYWKNLSDSAAERLPWNKFLRCTPSESYERFSKSILFCDGLEMNLGGAKYLQEKDNTVVLQLLNDIKALVESGIIDAQSSVDSEQDLIDKSLLGGLAACEFCQGKIKPEVTYCKHCGIKLRG